MTANNDTIWLLTIEPIMTVNSDSIWLLIMTQYDG